jgi:ribosome-associated protein
MAEQIKDDGDEVFVSKTQRKKIMDSLQELGRELVELPKEKLKKMDLQEDLLAAILEYKRISAHGAKKRQEQYIGRLMRDIDPEPIRTVLSSLKGESAEHTGWLHQVERWRDRLLEEDQALPVFLNSYPDADVQALRTLIRNARKEKLEARPPKFYRQVFQTIKGIIPEPGNARPASNEETDA